MPLQDHSYPRLGLVQSPLCCTHEIEIEEIRGIQSRRFGRDPVAVSQSSLVRFVSSEIQVACVSGSIVAYPLSEKWPMYDCNADEIGQKFRQVRYCVGTAGDRRLGGLVGHGKVQQS